MIELRILGENIGLGVNNDTGNGIITAHDRQSNILISLELTPDAWRGIMANMPRIPGIGIPIVSGRVPIIGAEDANNNGSGD